MNGVNATDYERIPTFAKNGRCDLVHVVIETPRDQRHKYAFDPKYGIFVRKEILSAGLTWPYDYGFVPQTLGGDGDPLDALFLGDEPTFTGCLVPAIVLGIVRLQKNGKENDRIITRPMQLKGVSQTTDEYEDLDDVPKDTVENVCRYLVEYSAEEGNTIEFRGTQSRKKALRAIEDGRKAFKKAKR